MRRQKRAITRATSAAMVVAALASITSCKRGSDSGPTAPSATAPPGCSGQPINNVWIRLGNMGGVQQQQRFTAEVYGETFSGQAPPGFEINRNVVVCDYELRVQILEGSLPFQIAFGFEGTRNQTGGVPPASIEVIEGPNPMVPPVFGSSVPGCLRDFGAGGAPLPATVRIKFRVVEGLRDGSRC